MGKNKIFFKMTCRQMKKNKVRTIVTIAGIILSVALITAISTFVSSLQNSMLEFKISENGSWHAVIKEVDSDERVKELIQKKEITDYCFAYNLGSTAVLQTESMKDICLKTYALDSKFVQNMPVSITSGRMAENSGEIVIDGSIINLYEELGYKLGDTIELSGKSYIIVGFCENPSYIDTENNEWFAFTAYDENAETEFGTDIYFTVKNANDIYDFLEKVRGEYETATNEGVLRLMGTSRYTSYYSFVYGLAVIVIVLVIGGSVLLIYNSFAISMNERSRQFGLLSSIGATKRQLRASIFYEAGIVSAVGIPLGIIIGIAGIGITLFCIRENMQNIAASVVSLGEMKLHVSAAAVLVAVAASLITIFLSAFIPMLKISRISAVDAIRQNTDIKLTKRKVKSSKLFLRVFGFEGMLGKKNFKRSRSKYRTTVISLFVSIVMFISASALGQYLITSIEGIYNVADYDIVYTTTLSDKKTQVIDEMKNVSYVTETGQSQMTYYLFEPDKACYSNEYIADKSAELGESEFYDSEEIRMVRIFGIQDDIYKEYLESNNLSVDEYMNIDNPKYLLYSNYRTMDLKTGKTKVIPVYKQQGMDMALYRTNGEKYNSIGISIAGTVEKLPYTVDVSYQYEDDIILCSQSMMNTLDIEKEYITLYTFFKTTDNSAAEEEMKRILKENNMNYQYNLKNVATEYESGKSMIFVIKVFSYGFFIMMSLIAMANVFNTISTNMLLRRREFAMLKSVGLTDKSFNKMLYYECFLYGSKSLLLGIPVSLLFVWWIYSKISDLWVMGFQIPYMAILICVISVYSIVFITMVYSKKKIQELNLIACIKEENI